MSYNIECVLMCENYLGEGPVWDVEEGCIYWVDGTGHRVGKPCIWRLDPKTGKVDNWSLDHDVGAMALRKDGGAVLALDDGFYFFDFEDSRLVPISKIEEKEPRTRLNDGKVDRLGRFFAGGMDDKEEHGIAGLWRLDPDLSTTKIDGGIICSNGPCWSPDDKIFYFTDTFQDEIWAYDYDLEAGTVSNRRVFASTEEEDGVADGSTVDEEGYLWNAQLISGDLIRYAPDGTIDRKISMPVRNITSVSFGGDGMDEIYVTSMARVDHPGGDTHGQFSAEVTPQFGAGSLFRVTGLGIRGVPEPRFAG